MTAATPLADAPSLAGAEDHPHARMVLASALASGAPSHAYLFHGPPGTGKRTVARSLAAELLAAGDADPSSVRRRVLTGSHPDLSWVKPTGAHVMRVDDVEERVIVAATRTPFEARRRVFVLEGAETMNDEVANRMLKTLEEPASFVHLLLVTDALSRVLETVVSRCQLVRFDPLPVARIAAALEREGVRSDRAGGCARLALGSQRRGRFLASEDGETLRNEVARLIGHALADPDPDPDADSEVRPADAFEEPWQALLERAEHSRAEAEAAVAREQAARLELEPKGRARSALSRDFDEAAKRDGRRARTAVLELALDLAAIEFRDLACVAEGATDAVLASDRRAELGARASGRDPGALRTAVERCDETRRSLQLNVNEELALQALNFRLRGLFAG